jgi:hypothetical protein
MHGEVGDFRTFFATFPADCWKIFSQVLLSVTLGPQWQNERKIKDEEKQIFSLLDP